MHETYICFHIYIIFSQSRITKVVSSNPVHGYVYAIQNYMIKIVSDLQQVCGSKHHNSLKGDFSNL